MKGYSRVNPIYTRTILEPYQSHNRATTEPQQSHNRATTEPQHSLNRSISELYRSHIESPSVPYEVLSASTLEGDIDAEPQLKQCKPTYNQHLLRFLPPIAKKELDQCSRPVLTGFELTITFAKPTVVVCLVKPG